MEGRPCRPRLCDRHQFDDPAARQWVPTDLSAITEITVPAMQGKSDVNDQFNARPRRDRFRQSNEFGRKSTSGLTPSAPLANARWKHWVLSAAAHRPGNPTADLIELADEIVVQVDLPGLTAEAIELNLVGNMLSLSATRMQREFPLMPVFICVSDSSANTIARSPARCVDNDAN